MRHHALLGSIERNHCKLTYNISLNEASNDFGGAVNVLSADAQRCVSIARGGGVRKRSAVQQRGGLRTARGSVPVDVSVIGSRT